MNIIHIKTINGYALYGDIHKYLLNRKYNFHNPLYPNYYNDFVFKKKDNIISVNLFFK